jgi:hypothetical protein
MLTLTKPSRPSLTSLMYLVYFHRRPFEHLIFFNLEKRFKRMNMPLEPIIPLELFRKLFLSKALSHRLSFVLFSLDVFFATHKVDDIR